MVTSLPSLSVCISLSLSHRKYLTHNIGSGSALPIMCFLQRTVQSSLSPNPLKKGRSAEILLMKPCFFLYKSKLQPAVVSTQCRVFEMTDGDQRYAIAGSSTGPANSGAQPAFQAPHPEKRRAALMDITNTVGSACGRHVSGVLKKVSLSEQVEDFSPLSTARSATSSPSTSGESSPFEALSPSSKASSWSSSSSSSGSGESSDTSSGTASSSTTVSPQCSRRVLTRRRCNRRRRRNLHHHGRPCPDCHGT